MRKIHSHTIFVLGSIMLLLIAALYYSFIPTHEYFGKGFSAYPPGEGLPVHFNGEYSVSNIYLLNRLTMYFIEYLGVFVLVYFILMKFTRIEISKTYVWLHLILIVLGSLLLIYLNPYITAPEDFSGYIADIFFTDELSEDQILHANELMLWYSAIGIKTSIIGILLLLAGVAVFVFGTFRAWKTGPNNMYST